MFIRKGLVVAAFLFFTVGLFAACERIALMPRPEIDREGRPIDRNREVTGDRDLSRNDQRDMDLSRNEQRDIVGTVERIDRSSNEIRLRTTDGQVLVIKYDPATVVYNRDQDIGISGLRPRDQVLVTVSRNSRGDQYADRIRLNDSSTLGRTY